VSLSAFSLGFSTKGGILGVESTMLVRGANGRMQYVYIIMVVETNARARDFTG